MPAVSNVCDASDWSEPFPSLKSHEYPVMPVSSVDPLPVKATSNGTVPEILFELILATGAVFSGPVTFIIITSKADIPSSSFTNKVTS
ncbi:hypothetical protein ZONE111904_00005 [Zobellia nedashkovskayae]